MFVYVLNQIVQVQNGQHAMVPLDSGALDDFDAGDLDDGFLSD